MNKGIGFAIIITTRKNRSLVESNTHDLTGEDEQLRKPAMNEDQAESNMK